MKNYTLFLVFASLVVVSCKKKQSNSIVYGYDYFPTTQGQFITYDVLDVFHDVALDPAHDTNRYQIKEVIEESFLDNEGEVAHKLKRYKRTTEADSWVLKDVWTMKQTKTTAEVVEENDRFIKLIFAIAYDRTWNCNALNNEPEQTCFYENIYEPYTVNGTQYDSTVVVEKENFTTFIDFKRKFDVYAKGIGKIHSTFKDLRIDNFDTTDIQKGSEIFYTAIDFGIE